MGFAQLQANPDMRARIGAAILAEHGTYDAWWASLQREFGSLLVGKLAAARPEDLAKFADNRLASDSPAEAHFWECIRDKVHGIEPQVSVGPYWIDFGFPRQRVGIEIDGHDYHSSREQRTADAKRQRYLERQGWRIIRFTASETAADVQQCVGDVLAFLASLEGAE